MSRSAALAAPAKVNLLLRVLGQRGDGYHDIETLFQAIDFADEVEVELTGSGVALDVRGADLGPPGQNLAFRAAAELRQRSGCRDGVKVTLTKRIPAGAGLGGGSSDAAAVLRCLARLLDVGDERVVREVGAALGSDVPFFLGSSPLAWGRGRGEVLEPLTPLPPADLVVVSPPVHVSTAAAYAALDQARRRSGRGAEARGRREPRSGTPLQSWRDLEKIACNDFQEVIAHDHPDVARSLLALERAGATVSLMSGSGSTCFGLVEDHPAARFVAERIQEELGWPCRAVRTLRDFPPL